MTPIAVSSHLITIRRRVWQVGRRQDAGTAVVHVREIEGQGGCHESYENGASAEEGTDQSQIMNS